MILIVGCGHLGNYLIQYIRSRTDEAILATVRDMNNSVCFPGVEYLKCDITCDADLKNLKNRISDNNIKVFYLAASHNIDYVYKKPEEARMVNINGLQNFLDNIKNIESLFYASTDCVYGESKNSGYIFTESDKPEPINEYGHQKAEAENIVLSYGFNVIRFSLLFGPSLNKKKNFYDKLCSDLKNGKQIEMIDGMKRQVISYADAARYMYELSMVDNVTLPSVVNVCGDKLYSKYDMGRVIADKLNLSQAPVSRVSEEQGSKFFSDKRASHIVLDNSLLKSVLNIDEILWEETKC